MCPALHRFYTVCPESCASAFFQLYEWGLGDGQMAATAFPDENVGSRPNGFLSSRTTLRRKYRPTDGEARGGDKHIRGHMIASIGMMKSFLGNVCGMQFEVCWQLKISDGKLYCILTRHRHCRCRKDTRNCDPSFTTSTTRQSPRLTRSEYMQASRWTTIFVNNALLQKPSVQCQCHPPGKQNLILEIRQNGTTDD